jgi:hypothetical protein
MRCLSENPIVPTIGDVIGLLQERALSGYLSEEGCCGISATTIRCVMREWQRRMFLAPEPEVPEEIKDLLYNEHDIAPPYERHNNLVIEAERRGFLRGQESGK